MREDVSKWDQIFSGNMLRESVGNLVISGKSNRQFSSCSVLQTFTDSTLPDPASYLYKDEAFSHLPCPQPQAFFNVRMFCLLIILYDRPYEPVFL